MHTLSEISEAMTYETIISSHLISLETKKKARKKLLGELGQQFKNKGLDKQLKKQAKVR